MTRSCLNVRLLYWIRAIFLDQLTTVLTLLWNWVEALPVSQTDQFLVRCILFMVAFLFDVFDDVIKVPSLQFKLLLGELAWRRL